MSPLPRRPPALLLLVPTVVAVVMFYPFALQVALIEVGARGVAFVMAAIAIGSMPWQRREGGESWIPLPHRVAFGALLTAALFLDDAVILDGALIVDGALFLRLLPAVAQWALFSAFFGSLRDPQSLIERGARMLQPFAPDFIGAYCRKVTAVWSGFFLINALAIAGLAIAAPVPWWSLYTSWILMGAVTVIFAVEFAVRKSWFRYYAGGPVDRVLATLLPAEKTEQGRRSMAYIRDKRKELGRELPTL
jgi:uncharacterized membrane protein